MELARQGVPVTVLEAARELGGRARRVPYRGVLLDNGQHILLGAYHQLLRLLQIVQTPPNALLRLPLQLKIDGQFTLRAGPGPGPFHLLTGLLTARGLNLQERLAAIQFMRTLARMDFTLARDLPVSELLRQHRQGNKLIAYLWAPLCVAALNTPLEAASAQIFLNVLRDSLHRQRADSDLLLPRIDLTQLFPERAAAYIEARGGSVKLGAGVDRISAANRSFYLAGVHPLTVSHVICATGPHQTARLLRPHAELAPTVERLAQLSYQPIYTVYLQYPAAVGLSQPMLGLSGGLAQWVFDRGQLCGQAGLLAGVISASGPHQNLSLEEVALSLQHEMAARFPGLGAPLWHKVVAEKRATFSCTPGLVRPTCSTPLKHFFLAGDYTVADYPATLESAVRSGVECATRIVTSIAN